MFTGLPRRGDLFGGKIARPSITYSAISGQTKSFVRQGWFPGLRIAREGDGDYPANEVA
jgi:hypothetical protein